MKANIIYDGRSDMSVVVFRTAPPIDGLSCFCPRRTDRQTDGLFVAIVETSQYHRGVSPKTLAMRRKFIWIKRYFIIGFNFTVMGGS